VRFELVSSKGRPQRPVGQPESAWIHNFNVGVDRFRSFSLTRTTTVSLTGGTGVVNDLEGQRIVVLGSGGIEKRFSRTVRGSIQARRDLSFVEGVAEPVLTNAVTGTLQAAAGRRWTFALHGVYGKGRAAAADDGPLGLEFETYTVEARVLYRLSGPFSAYADYFRAHRAFGALELEPVASPYTRNGVRFGLVVHMPIFGERGVE
jgi:hypothetical protein